MAVAIADYSQESTEVDLWGNLFTVIRITKANEDEVDDQLEAIDKAAEKLDLNKHATQIKVFGERMDAQLTPAAGGKKKASTILKEKWSAGDLTLVQLNRFWSNVLEEINRPT